MDRGTANSVPVVLVQLGTSGGSALRDDNLFGITSRIAHAISGTFKDSMTVEHDGARKITMRAVCTSLENIPCIQYGFVVETYDNGGQP